ncbi:hypothetical protein D9757_012098 [Collybiopsis confluens]|uniref:CUE domain-containing protein n=1 Tax=Collybiopsis confluens TaxID=2823264 RepID=A0A8H5D3B9_9AGAR|nr:hypothetical protein D9757_012098 [Collybiopsis confluens]
MVGNSIATRLPGYPATSARKALSPTQLATLYQTISSSLFDVLALPPSKRNAPAARTFIFSYAKDTAVQTLEGLIWESNTSLSKIEKTIRLRVLQLAEALASDLDVQTLLDLAIVYASTNLQRMKDIFNQSRNLAVTDLVSPFLTLLQSSDSPGLYALRKTSYCVSALLRVAPPAVLRSFSHSKDFILALAQVYQSGLGVIAHSYGGVNLATPADDWEKIWLETKVSFMDSFHVCMVGSLNDVASASGRALAVEAESIFDIVFALMELSLSTGQARTPFLNQSILSDYQQSYDLTRTLTTSLRHATERDARLDLLEASLSGVDAQGKKDPGALKLLLRSSGAQPGIDNRGSSSTKTQGKGKIVSHTPPITSTSQLDAEATTIPNLDSKVNQVLDVFPEQSSDYIRDLLLHPSYPFARDTDGAARVISALLEGTAPSWDEVRNAGQAFAAAQKSEQTVQQSRTERRNVFDDEEINLSQFRVGKKREQEAVFLRDRESIEQMKADVLRRVENFSSSEDENRLGSTSDTDDELLPSTAFNAMRVTGDGEESDGSDEGILEGEETPAQLDSVEAVLELVYITDPKIFDRDSRGSKPRADLKAKTRWADDQIEWWRIMLERDPKKRERILRKHEWSGNKPLAATGPSDVPSASNLADRGGGGGRSRGGDRGRSRNRGAGRGRGTSGHDTAKERDWKEKHKNAARKRGHDKKMAHSGAAPPT